MHRREFLGLGAWFLIRPPDRAVPGSWAQAPLKLVVGDRFDFRTTTAKRGGVGATTFNTARGPAFLAPLPIEQSVRIVMETQCVQSLCLALEAERTLAPFLSESGTKGYAEKISAHIDKATGAIYDVKTTINIDGSISVSSERSLARNAMVADFYGAWMLDLRNDYRQTTKDSGRTITLTVAGAEKVAGRDCFIVKQLMEFDAGQKAESTIWVDVRRRFAVKIARGQSQMQLVK